MHDDDLRRAFASFYHCVRPSGGCLISVRDYDHEDRAHTKVVPCGLRETNDKRYLVFQVWTWDGDHYDVSMYFVEDTGHRQGAAHIIRTRYYAVRIAHLMALLEEAGFSNVHRIDGIYYQPLLVGTKR